MATVFEEYSTEEQRYLVRYLREKELTSKDIHKEMFTVGSVCRVKRFTAESRNFHCDGNVSVMTIRLKRRYGSG
jgi:hypothetical protein